VKRVKRVGKKGKKEKRESDPMISVPRSQFRRRTAKKIESALFLTPFFLFETDQARTLFIRARRNQKNEKPG
jgi:hypothetical protein